MTTIGPDEEVEKIGSFYETLTKIKPQRLNFEQFFERTMNRTKTNRILFKKPAQKKTIKIDKILISSKTDGWLKKAALFFGLSLGVLVAIQVLVGILRNGG